MAGGVSMCGSRGTSAPAGDWRAHEYPLPPDGIATGDQAIFCTKAAFIAAGCYPTIA